MGDLVLSHVVDFTEGRVEGRIEENRVVAEAAVSTARRRDASLAGGAEQTRLIAGGAGQGGDGDVSGGAALVRDPFDLMKQEPAASRVVEIGGAVARRERAGAAAEGIDLQTGVVREGRQARQRRVMPGLADGVLLVGAGGLFVRLADAEVGGGQDLDAERGQKTHQLARLAGIESGDEKPGPDRAHGRGSRAGRTSRRVFLWCSKSWLTPWLARSSIPFISSGENGVFSPVPCTST